MLHSWRESRWKYAHARTHAHTHTHLQKAIHTKAQLVHRHWQMHLQPQRVKRCSTCNNVTVLLDTRIWILQASLSVRLTEGEISIPTHTQTHTHLKKMVLLSKFSARSLPVIPKACSLEVRTKKQFSKFI